MTKIAELKKILSQQMKNEKLKKFDSQITKFYNQLFEINIFDLGIKMGEKNLFEKEKGVS